MAHHVDENGSGLGCQAAVPTTCGTDTLIAAAHTGVDPTDCEFATLVLRTETMTVVGQGTNPLSREALRAGLSVWRGAALTN